MERVGIIIHETNSIPFATFRTKKKVSEKKFNELYSEWLKGYLKENGYILNPFYFFITTEKQLTKSEKRLRKIVIDYETN